MTTASATEILLDPDAADVATSIAALDALTGIPVDRWRFSRRVVVGGRDVVSTTRLTGLDEARAQWADAAVVTLRPMTRYHGHLLVTWATEGTADGAPTRVIWDPSGWDPDAVGWGA